MFNLTQKLRLIRHGVRCAAGTGNTAGIHRKLGKMDAYLIVAAECGINITAEDESLIDEIEAYADAAFEDEARAKEAERDRNDPRISCDAQLGDTGMAKDDYLELYTRNPDLMDW